MSLDTKYRPRTYADVLGQEATIQVCKEYVRTGHGFRQSYVFAGSHGGGKTTLGRILARALLCESPQEGEPCDKCSSCEALLADGHESFIEVDAATNSGKEHVKRITDEAKFGSFSGSRKLYLFDESHELSRQAMDSMLKPLEDNLRGTQDKQLVCIFCTTEPEKMRSAILSRCAPVFRIRNNTPDEIAKRLAHICETEEIPYEPEVLPVIAEVCECHIRDTIKAIEGVSMLGRVDRDNVARYLQLDANAYYLDLLESLGSDLRTALKAVSELDERVSPATCYERMAEVCMLAYKLVVLGNAPVPSFWDRDRLLRVGEKHRDFLLDFAQSFAERPHRATSSMFACDISLLHQRRAGVVVRAPLQEMVVASNLPPTTESPAVIPAEVAPPVKSAPVEISLPPTSSVESSRNPPHTVATVETPPVKTGSISKEPFVSPMGVGVNPAAQNRSSLQPKQEKPTGGIPAMTTEEFILTLRRAVLELQEVRSGSGRSSRFNDLGHS